MPGVGCQYRRRDARTARGQDTSPGRVVIILGIILHSTVVLGRETVTVERPYLAATLFRAVLKSGPKERS